MPFGGPFGGCTVASGGPYGERVPYVITRRRLALSYKARNGTVRLKRTVRIEWGRPLLLW